ncbi:hypothetical protein Plhal304r1_c002g0005321 [Plasmopara halstedii]
MNFLCLFLGSYEAAFIARFVIFVLILEFLQCFAFTSLSMMLFKFLMIDEINSYSAGKLLSKITSCRASSSGSHVPVNPQ